MKTLLIALLPTCALLAQNNEVSFYSGVMRHSSVVRPDSTKIEHRSAGMFHIANQCATGSFGRLSLEFPIMWADGRYQSSTRALLGRKANTTFLTPGLRLQHNLSARTTVYAAAGLGIVVTNERVDIQRPNFTATATGTAYRVGLAGNIGGGIDLRLTRLLSIRFETRDFITKRNSTLFRRHNITPLVGIALHF
jgi:hypothetical protein